MSLSAFKPKYQSIELENLLVPECKTLLDVGCGSNSSIRFFSKKFKKTVGIDIFDKSLKRSSTQKIHDKYVNADIMTIDKLFKEQSFDAVIAMDVIEHFNKKKALELISKMERIAKKVVVIGTPNGFVPQQPIEGNKYQEHKCGFTSDELRGLGYSIKGMDGPKNFRGEGSAIKYKPTIIFAILSTLLDPLLRYFPNWSYSLLAYRKVEK